MPSITVPVSFFRSERDSVYSDWRAAFWRELLSNSLDAEATRIRIRTRFRPDCLAIDMVDNGRGMTRDILENIYMQLGASTKGQGDGIGGFGRARILTCFSQDRYAIRSGNFVVKGQGAAYTISEAEPIRGCAVTIGMPREEGFRIYQGLMRVLEQSSLRATIEIDFDPNPPEDVWLPNLKDRNFSEGSSPAWRRFRGWSRLGRHFETLADENGPWADLHVNEGALALKGSAITRVNGMAMYDEVISSPVQVGICLRPERAREILTASRDSLRAPFRGILQEVYQRIGSERLSAFRRKPEKPRTELRYTEDTQAQSGFTIPRKPQAQRPGLIAETPSARPLVERHAPSLEASANSEPKCNEYGLLYPLAIHIHDPTPAQRAVIDRYRGDLWVQSGSEGRSSELLMAAWTAACRHALTALAGARPDLLPAVDEKWVTGFVFDREMYACYMPVNNISHGLLLNPVDLAGRMRFRISDPASMKQLIAESIHEVSHIASRRHDEQFASVMTTLLGQIRDRDIERDIRAEIDKMRDWQSCRQEAYKPRPAQPARDTSPSGRDEPSFGG